MTTINEAVKELLPLMVCLKVQEILFYATIKSFEEIGENNDTPF
jgi:hypothetical protein